ncbi:MAG TPA: hypothetical protein ENN03_10980 [bacterium]|nr:hypothetical protein [bacterium]
MSDTKNNQQELRVLSFGNETREDRKRLKRFVDFHWTHYRDDPQYVPLLDYEYLGFKLLGIHGFFEPSNLFFKHAEMAFFLAYHGDRIVGRCNAFVNHRHNEHWKDKAGFVGQFESVEDPEVAASLLDAAGAWLRSRGMEIMRGPQNLPVNDATPGLMTEGFDSRPVMYYHYNKPYYADLFRQAGMKPVKRVFSWEVDVNDPWVEKLVRVAEKVIQRYKVKIEAWDDRPLPERKKEMLAIYNAAWDRNFGFVPFTDEEFSQIIDDMLLIMDKRLFIFVYIQGEPAGFFGGVPNVSENLRRIGKCRHCELLRALKMVLFRNRTSGFRVGYLGVKPKFRHLGLDGVMLYKQKQCAKDRGYRYSDMGWVLEDNVMAIRLVEMFGAAPSKTYTIFERALI